MSDPLPVCLVPVALALAVPVPGARAGAGVWIETGDTLRRPGEPVRIDVGGDPCRGLAFADVDGDGRT